MASKFVSAGGAEIKAPEGLSAATDDAWAQARKQIEENKRPKEQGPAPGTQEGGVSLFDHLQAQKAAKQEAFEEATKLRNQFRPLDESEVEFLQSIKQKEKAQAVNERQETAQQLDAFRKQQAAAEQLADAEPSVQSGIGKSDGAVETWTTAKKRRRPLAADPNSSTKARKTSEVVEIETPAIAENTTQESATTKSKHTSDIITKEVDASPNPVADSKIVSGSVLVGYDSGSDD